MTTTIYTVASAADLAADIAAIDAASQAGTGSGTAYEIDIAAGAALSETAALPSIALNGSDTLTIQGNGGVLNGNAQEPGLDVLSGAVTIDNLTIENALTLGSNDGGFGVGGGLFVGRNTTVTLNNVSFANDAVTGGTVYNPNGGVALGGDIFVQQNGTLTIEGGVIGVGTVSGGAADAGDGIYIESTQAIMLAPGAGQVTTINGVIADEHSLDGSINAGTLIVDGAGTVLLNPEISPTNTAPTANTFAGGVRLQSGTLELASAQAAGTGTIVFGAPATGNPSPVLKLDPGAFGNGSLANAITGFNIGDTIDLAGLSTQSVAYVSQTQTLTVGGETINLSLQSNLAAANLSFVTSSDGHGGTDVMLNVAPPTVTISSPAESSTVASQTIAGSVTSSSGAIVVGQILTLTDNGVTLGTTQVASNGSFTTTVTLPNQGSNSIIASLTDSFGNTGSSAPVIDQLGGVAPAIAGTVAGQTTMSEAAVKPFAKVTIADPNNGATDTLTITLGGTGGKLTGTGLSGSGSSYTLSGTAATITSELDALNFTPTAGQANTSSTTTFTLSARSTAYATATANSTTTVTDSDAAIAPTITGMVAGQLMGDQKTIDPFARVVVTDPNASSSDTVIVLINGGGTLSGTGVNYAGAAGHYTVSGASLAALNANMQAAVYTPVASTKAQQVSFQIADDANLAAGSPGAGMIASATNSVTTLTVDPGPAAGKVTDTLQVGTSVNLTSAVLAAATAGIKGDTLSITAVNGNAALGSFALVNGQLIYAASTGALSHIAANGSQADTLGYTIADQYGDTVNGTVNITVTNPADVINGGPFGFATTQGTAGTDIINTYGFFNTIYAKGGNDVINAGQGNATVSTGSGDVATNLAGFFNTVSGGDGWNTVKGSQGNTSVTLGNGNDTIIAAGFSNQISLGSGTNSISGGQGLETIVAGAGNNTIVAAGYSNQISLGSGTNSISGGQGLETIVVGAGTDAIAIGGFNNNVTLNGSHANVGGGQGNDTISVNGGSDNLSFGGWSDTAAINGVAAVNISDLGAALTMKIGSSTQTDTITGFGSSDPSGVVDLLNGAGGYASTAQILSNLHSDGHGGTLLALGSQGSIDFAGTAQSQLHASSFRIG
jgi:hypothetical protein